jgi:hypothetical protein
MRRRRVPVDVREGIGGAPIAFRWRGRRYEVRAVVAHWIEAVPWWLAGTGTSRMSEHGGGQVQAWRVEAVSRAGTSGTYDLVKVARAEGCAWGLRQVID